MKLGGQDYLIQQNWLNANGGKCALAYPVTPDFSLSVSPTSQTLASTGGTTGNYTITETAVNGFTGGVSYAITGLPSWATASAVSSAGTFTVSAANPVQGTYNFAITGSSTSPGAIAQHYGESGGERATAGFLQHQHLAGFTAGDPRQQGYLYGDHRAREWVHRERFADHRRWRPG